MYAQTTIIGNLTKSPDLKYIHSGTAIAKCSIAYTDGFGDKKSSHFMDIELWGKTAEAFNKYCDKGSKIMVVGFPKFEQWTANDGSNRSKHSLKIDSFEMLDSKPNDGNSQQSQPKQYQKQVANIPELDIDMDETVPF